MANPWPTDYNDNTAETWANGLSTFVTANRLNGVDVDWEDLPGGKSLQSSSTVQWLSTYTTTLRRNLPSVSGYIISHAPQIGYFALGYNNLSSSDIDYYNIQFYNQGSSTIPLPYTSANTIIAAINTLTISADKIILGKPVVTGDCTYPTSMTCGLVPVDQLGTILKDINSYIGGIMGWQWHDKSTAVWMQTLRTALEPPS